jgi:hypothetical protein
VQEYSNIIRSICFTLPKYFLVKSHNHKAGSPSVIERGWHPPLLRKT